MSKQIAILLDNSGSMFHPVGGANPNDKIYEAARGAEFFLENLIDELAVSPDAEFAISIHRFASSYQLLPGGAQIDTSQANFSTALASMQSSISSIENQAASSAAVGVMTDLYDGVRRVSDYLNDGANQPGFGAPDSKVIFVFTDGIQTISHGGTSMADYETDQGVAFSNLLDARGIKLIAWGTGSDALGAVLAELANNAVSGGTNPVSTSKVLFPIDEAGIFENCTAEIATNAFYIVSNNGVLPLAPAGQAPTRLLWEQFSLPRRASFTPEEITATHAVMATSQMVNHRDFDVLVDGSTRELILALVSHTRRVRPTIQAISPSGVSYDQSSSDARTFGVENAWALKVPDPEEGKWRVRITGDRKNRPMVLDLMARGVCKQFGLEAKSEPRNIDQAGEVVIKAFPRWDGEIAEGKLCATAHLLGGGSVALEQLDDGSFAGAVDIARPGITIIPVEVEGKLKATGESIQRVAYAIVQLGRATDPRIKVHPNVYEQGGDYQVMVQLSDARFKRSSQIRFGRDIQVSEFEMMNESTARVRIKVHANAVPGEREVVSYHPQAESDAPVRVVESKGGRVIRGQICCLRFNAAGKLIGVVLCDDQEVCIRVHDDSIRKLLEKARDANLSVKITVDSHGCLLEIEICR